MTKPHLSDLIKLARIGAAALADRQPSKQMQAIWTTICAAEDIHEAMQEDSSLPSNKE